jgi:hypothetical protein
LPFFIFALFTSSGCGSREPAEKTPQETLNQVTVAVYYLKFRQNNAYLVREVHEVQTDQDPRLAALEELIHGTPTTPGAAKVLPPDTKIRGFKVDNGLATVDFSQEVLNANVGSTGEALGIQSIVNTLTEFPDITKVAFTVEGKVDERARDWWGHVGLYEQPFSRNLSVVWEPAIWVTAPFSGEKITSPLKVSGSARVFEGTVTLRLVTEDGTKLAETFTTATAGAPERGSFETSLVFPKPAAPKGYLEVFWYSPEDGSEQDKVKIPVNF